MKHDLTDLRTLSIKEYLEYDGIEFTEGYGYDSCSSPFSSDSNPSFFIYHDNRFMCYSTGIHGDIFELVQAMHGLIFIEAVLVLKEYKELSGAKDYIIPPHYTAKKSVNNEFILEKYINNNPEEIKTIKTYAESRGIYDGYIPGITFDVGKEYGEWERSPAIIFVHRDEHLKITGAKFRRILPRKSIRFTARGTLNWYILSNLIDSYKEPTLFIMESETSANSLWEYCKKINKPAIIMSFGGVSAQVPIIPEAYESITDRRVIIDYDGDENKFNKRVKRFKDLGKPVRIILDKGEDINSLWMDGRIDIIYDLIK